MKTDEMTDNEMRVKIAEFCGWELVHFDPTFEFSEATNVWRNPKGVFVRDCFLPDYLNDLNAMHEAENRLSKDERDKYQQWLYRECEKTHRIATIYWRAITSTARQRAIAFLKTKLA